jgi:hypothetical protein
MLFKWSYPPLAGAGGGLCGYSIHRMRSTQKIAGQLNCKTAELPLQIVPLIILSLPDRLL